MNNLTEMRIIQRSVCVIVEKIEHNELIVSKLLFLLQVRPELRFENCFSLQGVPACSFVRDQRLHVSQTAGWNKKHIADTRLAPLVGFVTIPKSLHSLANMFQTLGWKTKYYNKKNYFCFRMIARCGSKKFSLRRGSSVQLLAGRASATCFRCRSTLMPRGAKISGIVRRKSECRCRTGSSVVGLLIYIYTHMGYMVHLEICVLYMRYVLWSPSKVSFLHLSIEASEGRSPFCWLW